MLKKLHVLIADDHDLMRQALKLHVEFLGDNVMISEARSYDDVLRILAETKDTNPPRLVVLDLHMPGKADGSPLESVSSIQKAAPESRIIIFSATDDPVIIRAALRMGIQGYVPKTTNGRSLVSALSVVLNGQTYVPPEIMNEINALQTPDPATESATDLFDQLTEREFAALKSLTQGMTNKQIGREMGLQDVTVKMHLRNAYRKIGATNRIEAVRIALASGIDQRA